MIHRHSSAHSSSINSCRRDTWTYLPQQQVNEGGAPHKKDRGKVNVVKIRHRQPADLDQCVGALAVVHHIDGYPLNWPTDPHGWLCPPGTLQAWIAETASGAVVGHVAVQIGAPSITANESATPPTAEVSRLFVVPAARRQTVASELLQHAQQWAADHGFDLTLEVTDDQRSAAIALYERTGWRHTHTTEATWTAADGKPVSLRHYTRSQDPRETPQSPAPGCFDGPMG